MAVLALLTLLAASCSADIAPDATATATLPGGAQAEGDISIDEDVFDSDGPDDGIVTSSAPSELLEQSVESADQTNGASGSELAPTAIITPDDPAQPNCVAPEVPATTNAPEWVVSALETAVDHPDFDGLDVSVSVWIDGWGEVATRNPDLELVPASNEKILVAHAANELLDPTSTIQTSIEQVGSDLVFRAGGDPTFTTWRAHLLIDQVVAAGINSVDNLIIDVSQFPQPAAAPGWQGWQLRNFVGPLSGFMLDDNRWNTTEEFLEAPATLNGEWFREALGNAGVSVDAVVLGSPDPGRVVATVESEPISELVTAMMLFSDNQIADMLVLQMGLLDSQGTLADGIDEIEAELAELCVPLTGVMDDGSGLSRGNHRSAREFQQILRAIRDSDTAQVFDSQLPIGGISGTLGGRFRADPYRVRAKTGTLFGGRALSGYATTDSGRDVVFSILINGERERTSASIFAMDSLVRTILRS